MQCRTVASPTTAVVLTGCSINSTGIPSRRKEKTYVSACVHFHERRKDEMKSAHIITYLHL